MSEGVPIGAVERVLHKATVGTLRAIRSGDRRRASTSAKEIEQQFQVPVSGTANNETLDWQTVRIDFAYAFHFAPAARESNLEYPHFTYGGHSKPAVAIHATVEEWLHDETNGSIIGAIVAIAAQEEGVTFKGVAHLRFQGYAAFLENDEAELVNSGEETEPEEG